MSRRYSCSTPFSLWMRCPRSFVTIDRHNVAGSDEGGLNDRLDALFAVLGLRDGVKDREQAEAARRRRLSLTRSGDRSGRRAGAMRSRDASVRRLCLRQVERQQRDADDRDEALYGGRQGNGGRPCADEARPTIVAMGRFAGWRGVADRAHAIAMRRYGLLWLDIRISRKADAASDGLHGHGQRQQENAKRRQPHADSGELNLWTLEYWRFQEAKTGRIGRRDAAGGAPYRSSRRRKPFMQGRQRDFR